MQLDPPPQLFSQQRHIHQLQQELKALRNVNEQLKAQLHDVAKERDHLANIQQQDPIKMILQGLDGMSERVSLNSQNKTLEQRIRFHQDKILTLEQQLRELTNNLNQKDGQLLEINKMLQSLRQKETSLLNENNRLSLENHSLKEQKNQLFQTIEKYNSKWEKLATEINQAKFQFFQTTSKNSQELLNCQQDIDKLRNSWLRAANFLTDQEEWRKREEPGKIQQLNEKIKLQSQIMEELGRELDMRNDQIAQIHKKKNKNPQMNPYDTYEHSLNNMIHSAKQRQRQYTDLLKKYQSITQNYKQSLKQKQMLQNQYTKLKESYENISAMQKDNQKLRRQLEGAGEDLAKQKYVNKQILDQLEVCVEENQLYVDLMKDIYGSEVMDQRMKKEKELYEQRRRERVSKELWANTIELIEMNQKLKQKLRKQ